MPASFAFVFPGQGSQSVGMLAEVAIQHPSIIETFKEASDLLHYDLWTLVSEGPADQLNQTEYTQPALMAADIAVWRLWCEKEKSRPTLLAGHSLGEWVALVAANAIDYQTALQLVQLRGQLMQKAVPTGVGAMAAIIGLAYEAVSEICTETAAGEIVSPANLNSPEQIVIAGNTAAVERAVLLAKNTGAKLAKLLPVSVPSHCALMHPAAEALQEALAQIIIKSPQIPLIQNIDANIHNDPEIIRKNLISQLTQPVRWTETIQNMEAQGIENIWECGPGAVLQGLTKRISKGIRTESVINQLTSLNSY